MLSLRLARPLTRDRVMSGSCALGIDLGTGSVKAALLAGAGTKLDVAAAPVALSRPRPGWVESDPEDWWGAVKMAVREVLSRAEASGYCHRAFRPDARSRAVGSRQRSS